MQVSWQVRHRGVTAAAENDYSKLEFNALLGTQPIQVMEQWSKPSTKYLRVFILYVAYLLNAASYDGEILHAEA